MRNRLLIWGLSLLSGVLLSIPWLVPHTGWVVLFAFIPLLIAEEAATRLKLKGFWWCHYCAFVLWNVLTTFWVCNATVGGGIFAIMANSLQMSVVFGLFHFSRRHLRSVLPYILLAAAWIAWERLYLNAQISWPWLVLGNAFADTTRLVQWYEWTGTLGGSLWCWIVNLGLFGSLMTLLEGTWRSWTAAARISAIASMILLLVLPVGASFYLYNRYEPEGQTIDVLIAQPNLDPYHKFESMTQAEQNDVLLRLFSEGLAQDPSPALLIAPETFTSDIVLNDIGSSPTVGLFTQFLQAHPGCEMLFGASAFKISDGRSAPSALARPFGDGWLQSYNSALTLDAEGNVEQYNKRRLVVGTELTPYPAIFLPLERFVCRIAGIKPPLMGRCEGQGDPAEVLHFRDSIALGCAVCYESIYGEFCTDYVRKGARAMTVITNDAWWGDTPGHRQHCNYSRLRAIELRREIARCGNTGISCIIDGRGNIVSRGPWWEPYQFRSSIHLNDGQTAFVRHGDIVGRVSTLVFLLIAALLAASFFRRRAA